MQFLSQAKNIDILWIILISILRWPLVGPCREHGSTIMGRKGMIGIGNMQHELFHNMLLLKLKVMCTIKRSQLHTQNI